MPHPVYPFKAVLRSLRQEAGLSILAAADAVEYVNYERWETGKTKVGSRYLGTIAAAFGVTDELWALLYAWLLDRYTPGRGQGRVDLPHTDLVKVVEQLPSDVIYPEANKDLGIQPTRHVDFALLALLSGRWRVDRLELEPRSRARLPLRDPGQSTLAAAYGDVANEAIRFGGRTILGALHAGDRLNEVRALLVNLAPLLTSSSALDRLAGELDEPLAGEVRQAASATARIRDQLAVFLEAASGSPPTDEELDRFAVDVFAGRQDCVDEVMSAALRRGVLPEYDPMPMRDLGSGSLRMMDRIEQQARLQAVRVLEQLDPAQLLSALEAIECVRAD